jgi:hypothetical protein
MVFNIFDFESPEEESSIFKAIPIQYLDETKEILKGMNIRYYVRYRGPRLSTVDSRPYYLKQSICLRKFATKFSVYSKN